MLRVTSLIRTTAISVAVVVLGASCANHPSPIKAQATPPLPTSDCIAHDPSKLSIVDASPAGWRVVEDNTHWMLLLATRADAEKALTLARSYAAHCFIGRNNARPERRKYITDYWMNPDDATVAITSPDCIPYDQNTVRYESAGADGWRVVSDLPSGQQQSMLIFDTEADAQAGVAVARHYRQQCFIGRDNTRPNRFDYIVTYWQNGTSTAGPPVTTPPVSPSQGTALPTPDCIAHDPNNLTIVSAGALGWQLIDSGNHAMLLLASETDAAKAMTLASAYHQHCFLGRGTTRANRNDYIFQYWIDPDDAVVTLPAADCIGYDPAAIRYEAAGDLGWRLVADVGNGQAMWMALLDTEADAQMAVAVAQHYTQQCFIGRDNTRTDRSSYIVTYWQ